MRASKLLVSSSSPAAPKRIQCANFSQSDTLPDTPHLTPATHPKHTLQTPSQTPLPNPSSKTLFEEIRAHPGVCGGLLFTGFSHISGNPCILPCGNPCVLPCGNPCVFRAVIRALFRAEIRAEICADICMGLWPPVIMTCFDNVLIMF